jgi:RluA family pseudouridine synthase
MKPATPVIKLSSPATREFWEIEVLFEDAQLLAVSKPARLLTSPDRYDPNRPNLMRLLLDGVAAGKPWARERGLTYLANAHRLDFETTGILLLAKDRPSLVTLANHFGSEIPRKRYLALVRGTPEADEFTVDQPLAQDRFEIGKMRVSRTGKKSVTDFRVLEKFTGCTLMECRPRTGRTHQIRVHLQYAGHPIYGDMVYDGEWLLLSVIKRGDYRLKPGREERPLIGSLALHAAKLDLPHPATGAPVHIEAPTPREFNVALKYLRRYGRPEGALGETAAPADSGEPE